MEQLPEQQATSPLPFARGRPPWLLPLLAGILVLLIAAGAFLVVRARSQTSVRPIHAGATAAPVVAAFGGSGSETKGWFHLDRGRYRVSWKADNGRNLEGACLVRKALVDPASVASADQTKVVVFLDQPGEQIVSLDPGDYFINVAMLGSGGGWTVDMTKIG